MNVLRSSDAAAVQACAAHIVELIGAVHGPSTLVISSGPPEYPTQIAAQQADWYVA